MNFDHIQIVFKSHAVLTVQAESLIKELILAVRDRKLITLDFMGTSYKARVNGFVETRQFPLITIEVDAVIVTRSTKKSAVKGTRGTGLLSKGKKAKRKRPRISSARNSNSKKLRS